MINKSKSAITNEYLYYIFQERKWVHIKCCMTNFDQTYLIKINIEIVEILEYECAICNSTITVHRVGVHEFCIYTLKI